MDMDYIKNKLQYVGGFLVSAGVFSIILYFIDYNLSILIWIDLWGETVGWIIRGGITLLGAVLWVVSKMMQSKTGVVPVASEKAAK